MVLKTYSQAADLSLRPCQPLSSRDALRCEAVLECKILRTTKCSVDKIDIYAGKDITRGLFAEDWKQE